MTAPQTGTYPGAPQGAYPPPLTEPLAPEPPPKEDLVRQQLGTLALLLLLTSITLGVVSSSVEAFWVFLRFSLVAYTLVFWFVWLMNWRKGRG